MATIFHHGGGVGINFSKLRAKDSPLTSGGCSSGVLSFMEIFDAVTNSVKQGGFRRGALMGILNFEHAEIIDFIRSKLKDKLTNFNISILISDKFMEKVVSGESIELKNPQNDEIWNRVSAKDLFDLIAFSAWNSGDPGMLFYDRINKDNKYFPKLKIKCTNPCAEVPLMDYGACCLGSINISKFVKGNKFNFTDFSKYIELGARALLNMNAIAWYPLPQITRTMKEYNPIGLGIMGFADTLIKLGIYYDSEDTLNFIDEIAKQYIEITNKIAKDSFYRRIIAPTGSLSLLADCSSGIEPIFDTSFERHLTIGVIEETRDLYKSKFVRIAHDVLPEWHLKVLAKWQEKCDGGVSKTINMPYTASVEDVKNIYLQAWKMGVKGITIFRDGSKSGVLVRKENIKRMKCSDESCTL
jgi:ribonucleoside-diphosphate reductase alpha chain